MYNIVIQQLYMLCGAPDVSIQQSSSPIDSVPKAVPSFPPSSLLSSPSGNPQLVLCIFGSDLLIFLVQEKCCAGWEGSSTCEAAQEVMWFRFGSNGEVSETCYSAYVVVIWLRR